MGVGAGGEGVMPMPTPRASAETPWSQIMSDIVMANNNNNNSSTGGRLSGPNSAPSLLGGGASSDVALSGLSPHNTTTTATGLSRGAIHRPSVHLLHARASQHPYNSSEDLGPMVSALAGAHPHPHANVAHPHSQLHQPAVAAQHHGAGGGIPHGRGNGNPVVVGQYGVLQTEQQHMSPLDMDPSQLVSPSHAPMHAGGGGGEAHGFSPPEGPQGHHNMAPHPPSAANLGGGAGGHVPPHTMPDYLLTPHASALTGDDVGVVVDAAGGHSDPLLALWDGGNFPDPGIDFEKMSTADWERYLEESRAANAAEGNAQQQQQQFGHPQHLQHPQQGGAPAVAVAPHSLYACLLYTSDAADD